jgi:hypothetical protein
VERVADVHFYHAILAEVGHAAVVAMEERWLTARALHAPSQLPSRLNEHALYPLISESALLCKK